MHMTKNRCLESLRQLSKAVESFAASCGLEDVKLDLDQRANAVAYTVSDWLVGEEVSARLDAVSRQTAQCTARVEEMKKLLSEQEEHIRASDAQIQQLTQQLKQAREALQTPISGLIVMRDSLLARADLLRENGVAQSDERFKVVSVSLRETAALLSRMGVTIVEDSGAFDATRQTIADTISTQDPKLANQIARVFRPGYLYQGETLRGQEVIIYVKD